MTGMLMIAQNVTILYFSFYPQLVDDIVILRVLNGSDFFCIINGLQTSESCVSACANYFKMSNRKSQPITPAQVAQLEKQLLEQQTKLELDKLTVKTDGMNLKISHMSPTAKK